MKGYVIDAVIAILAAGSLGGTVAQQAIAAVGFFAFFNALDKGFELYKELVNPHE